MKQTHVIGNVYSMPLIFQEGEALCVVRRVGRGNVTYDIVQVDGKNNITNISKNHTCTKSYIYWRPVADPKLITMVKMALL